ncbi:MAG: hypothetical protein IPK93_06165 [Solirubrobacterales bacterium]|nr:hypothetical protein [Solirubrobacterales bacterium]
MKFRHLLAIGGVAALVLTGCGGGDDSSSGDEPTATVSAQDEAAITQVSAELERAAKAKDGVAFCDLIQPALIDSAFGSKARCAKAARGGLSDPALADLEIESITATSTGANVIYKNASDQNATFVKVAGNWYIDFPGSVDSSSAPPDG